MMTTIFAMQATPSIRVGALALIGAGAGLYLDIAIAQAVAIDIDMEAAPIATLLVAGDIADCGPGAAKTAALLDETPGSVLALGDLAYPNGSTKDFQRCYESTWGRFKSRTLPAPGNHEYRTKDAAGYYAYFGDQAGKEGKGYYSVDMPGWHIVSLNSNLRSVANDEQITWLREDLKNNTAACVLAFWHHPRYTSGPHGVNKHMAPVWRTLAEHGASLALSAHDHNYERIAPLNATGFMDDQGIRSFVVGTGGARLFNFGMRSNYSEAWNGTNWGVLKLTLYPGRYTWEFLAVEGGTYQDRGEGKCVTKS